MAVMEWLERGSPSVPTVDAAETDFFWLSQGSPEADAWMTRWFGRPRNFIENYATYDTVVLLRAEPEDPEALGLRAALHLPWLDLVRAGWRFRLLLSGAKVIATATCGDCIDHAFLGDLPGYSHTTFQAGHSDVVDLYTRDIDDEPAAVGLSLRHALQKLRQAQVEVSRQAHQG